MNIWTMVCVFFSLIWMPETTNRTMKTNSQSMRKRASNSRKLMDNRSFVSTLFFLRRIASTKNKWIFCCTNSCYFIRHCCGYDALLWSIIFWMASIFTHSFMHSCIFLVYISSIQINAQVMIIKSLSILKRILTHIAEMYGPIWL